MSAHQGFHLRLRQPPALSVDFAGVLPAALAGRSVSEVAQQPLWQGNQRIALGDLFDVSPLPRELPELLLEGDLRRFHAIGRGLALGRIHLDGEAGDYLGAEMSGGEISVSGGAGLLAGCAMSGGSIEMGGDVGDFAAAALPGAMDGMRGGQMVVHGNAGARFGDRMRRGTAVIHGSAGDFLASRMVAGTIAIAGPVGAHCGYGMRRGSLVFAGPAPLAPPTFAQTHHDIGVFWALLARSLKRHEGPFAGLAARRPRRLVGDLAADGKGEWLLPE